MNNTKPFVSVIVLVHKYHHLASRTIDSILNQSEKDYELLVLEKDSSSRDLQTLKSYSDRASTILSCSDSNVASMLNKGFFLARGKYINFLLSGDVYLSKFSLAHLVDFIHKRKKMPDMVCSAFLLRMEYAPPEVISRPFSLDFLKRGIVPTNLQSCFFSKKILEVLGGFDRRYNYREGFDLICRLFLRKERRIVFFRKVLMDYELERKRAYELFQNAKETLLVIYRNFGIIKTIVWCCVQNHFEFIKWWLYTIKQTFWRA